MAAAASNAVAPEPAAMATATADMASRTTSTATAAHNEHANEIVELLRAALRRSAPPLYDYPDVVTGEQSCSARAAFVLNLLVIPVHMAFDVVAGLGLYGVQPDGGVVPSNMAPALVSFYAINAGQLIGLVLLKRNWDGVAEMAHAIVGDRKDAISSFAVGKARKGRRHRGINLETLRREATAEHAALIRRAANKVSANSWYAVAFLAIVLGPAFMGWYQVPGTTAFAEHYGLDTNGSAVWALYIFSGVIMLAFTSGTAILLGNEMLLTAMAVETAAQFAGRLDAVVLPKLQAEAAARAAHSAPRRDPAPADGEGNTADGPPDNPDGGMGDEATVEVESTTVTRSTDGSNEDPGDLRELYNTYVQLRRVAAATKHIAPTMVFLFAMHVVAIIGAAFAAVFATPRYNPIMVYSVPLFLLALPQDFATPVRFNTHVRRARRRLAELRLMAGSLDTPVLAASLDRFARVLHDDAESGGALIRLLGVPISTRMVVTLLSGVATVTWLLLQPVVTASVAVG